MKSMLRLDVIGKRFRCSTVQGWVRISSWVNRRIYWMKSLKALKVSEELVIWGREQVLIRYPLV